MAEGTEPQMFPKQKQSPQINKEKKKGFRASPNSITNVKKKGNYCKRITNCIKYMDVKNVFRHLQPSCCIVLIANCLVQLRT